MGRVLRLAYGLMGVVVLLMTAGMAWARQDDSAWMLVREGNYNLEARLMAVDPKTAYRFPLTDYYPNLYTRAYARKSGWIYFTGGEIGQTSGLYRVNLNARTQPELIVPNTDIGRLWLAPSENWIVYSTSENAGDRVVYRLYRAKSDGQDRINLNGPDDSGLPSAITNVSFSPNEDQISFILHNTSGWNTSYIAQLDGTGITSSYPEVLGLRSDGSVLLMRHDGRLYLTDPFDSSTTIPFALSDNGQSYLDFGWLPNAQIAILKEQLGEDYKLLGVKAKQGILWSIDKVITYETTPQDDWIFVSGRDWIARLKPDGCQFKRIFETHDIEIFDFVVHEDWLIVLTDDRPNEDFRIYKIHHDGRDLTEVLRLPEGSDARLMGLTSDGKYIIFANTSANSAQKIYRVNSNGGDILSLTPGSNRVYLDLWLPPIDRGWTPSHLGIIGAGLIGITIIRPKKWWGKK